LHTISFGELNKSLERYNRGVQIPFVLEFASNYILGTVEPKKCRLGPQNGPGSFGPEKTVKKLPKWKLFFELVE
jgi:hypothetical protein